MNRDPELVRSSYSGPVTRETVTVRLEIYRLESDRQWCLRSLTSMERQSVCDDLTDSAAYEAFEAAVAQDGMGTFLDKADGPISPTEH